MAWDFISVSTVAEVTSGNITLNAPASAAQGDLYVACIAYRSNAAFTLPADWNLVATQQSSGDTVSTGGGIASGVMAYIVRGASDPSFTFTRTAGDVARGVVVCYRGNSATPYDTGNAATLAVSGEPALGEITTAEAGELLVAMVAHGDNITLTAFDAVTNPSTASGATDTTTDPTNDTWIERYDVGSNLGADSGLTVLDGIKATAGATGAFSADASVNSRSVTIVGAFKLSGAVTQSVSDTSTVSEDIQWSVTQELSDTSTISEDVLLHSEMSESDTATVSEDTQQSVTEEHSETVTISEDVQTDTGGGGPLTADTYEDIIVYEYYELQYGYDITDETATVAEDIQYASTETLDDTTTVSEDLLIDIYLNVDAEVVTVSDELTYTSEEIQFDTVTIEELFEFGSTEDQFDTLTISEDVSSELPGGDLTADKYDEITSTEFLEYSSTEELYSEVTVSEDTLINVYMDIDAETVTVSDAFDYDSTEFQFDIVTISEDISFLEAIYLSDILDTVAASDEITSLTVIYFSDITDTSTVSEDVTSLAATDISSDDTLTVSEDISLIAQLESSDTATLEEYIELSVTEEQFDSVAISEDIPFELLSGDELSGFDVTTVSEDVTAELEPLLINAFDDITVSDEYLISVDELLFDTITCSEYDTEDLAGGEEITRSEYDTVTVQSEEYLFDIYDEQYNEITVSDDLLLGITDTTFDSITVEDELLSDVYHSQDDIQINVSEFLLYSTTDEISDTCTVSDDIQLGGMELTAEPDDLISCSETVEHFTEQYETFIDISTVSDDIQHLSSDYTELSDTATISEDSGIDSAVETYDTATVSEELYSDIYYIVSEDIHISEDVNKYATGDIIAYINDIEIIFGYNPLVSEDISILEELYFYISEYIYSEVTTDDYFWFDISIAPYEVITISDICEWFNPDELISDQITVSEDVQYVVPGEYYAPYDEIFITEQYEFFTAHLEYDLISINSDTYEFYSDCYSSVSETVTIEDVPYALYDTYIEVFDEISVSEYIPETPITAEAYSESDYIGVESEILQDIFDAQHDSIGNSDYHVIDIGIYDSAEECGNEDWYEFGYGEIQYDGLLIDHSLEYETGVIIYDEIGIIELSVAGDLFAEPFEDISVIETCIVSLKVLNPIRIIFNRYTIHTICNASSVRLIAERIH